MRNAAAHHTQRKHRGETTPSPSDPPKSDLERVIMDSASVDDADGARRGRRRAARRRAAVEARDALEAAAATGLVDVDLRALELRADLSR